MGLFFSKPTTRLLRSWRSRDKISILMLGCDASGKTTMLYKLKINDIVTTIPTIGFNVETLEYENVKITVWDVGGCDKIRPIWLHYMENCNGFIFVVDSSDYFRVAEAREELHRLLVQHKDMRYIPLLVYANKQDCRNAMTADQLAEKLDLHTLKEREWMVQPSSFNDGDGIFEGLEWLGRAMESLQDGASPGTPFKVVGSEASSAKSRGNWFLNLGRHLYRYFVGLFSWRKGDQKK